MATPSAPDTSDIRRRGRQRLVGAVVIVLLLVVFVPMVLDSEPRQSRPEPSMAIPPKEGAPKLPPPAAAPAPAPEPVKAPEPTPEPPKAVEAPKPAPEPPKAPAKAAPPKLEGFAIQVGAFRDEAKLKHARDKLAAAGIVHYTERLDVKGGTLTRLRAGPFPTKEAAEAKLEKTKAIAPDAKVVPLP